MHTNPNEYDDDAFTEASLALMADPAVAKHVEGATHDDVVNEFENVVENAIGEIAPAAEHRGGGPKKGLS